MRKLFWLIFVALLAAAGWFGWAVSTPAQPASQTFVLLRPGYSTRRIAAELKSAGVIRSENAFILWHYVRRRSRSLKAGEYLFEKPASIIDIQKRLRRGDVYFHTVVVPEGFTMFDIGRAIEAAGLGPAADFVQVAKSDTGLIADVAPSAPSLEGYLFPETYEFSSMMTMQEMAAAMVCQFRKVSRQIGLIAAPGSTGAPEQETTESVAHGPATPGQGCGHSQPKSQPSAQTGVQTDAQTGAQPSNLQQTQNEPLTEIERTVIMASIIEKETRVPEERPLVASVYYNRLEKNVALDADPSIIYAELLAGTYTGSLHHADMQFHSSYNTYHNAGLPPGPIGNPGKSALEAAMHPAQSDYYYFVADAQGHHRFARTMEEHDKNVAAYRKAVRGH